MSDDLHDHARPDRAAHLSALGIGRAIVHHDPAAAHEAVSAAACPSCVVVAGLQFGFTLAAVFAGKPFVDEPLRLQLVAAIDAAERELRAAPN